MIEHCKLLWALNDQKPGFRGASADETNEIGFTPETSCIQVELEPESRAELNALIFVEIVELRIQYDPKANA